MGGLLLFIIVILLLAIICATPLYIVVNLLFWIFGAPYHITMAQAIALCLIFNVIHDLIYKKEGK